MQPTLMRCRKYTSIQLINNLRGLQIEKSNILKRNRISEKDSIRSDFFFSMISNFGYNERARKYKKDSDKAQ